jgi:hypothetical protein
MSVRIEKLDENREQSYQNLLLSSDKNLLYASLKYRSFLKKVLTKSDHHYLVAYQKKEMVAALPTFFMTSKKGDKMLNSLPFFGSNGGIIIAPTAQEHKEIKLALLSEFQSLAKRHNVISSTIITNPLLSDDDFFKKKFEPTYRDHRIGQVTLLPNKSLNEEYISSSLMDLYHYKTRNAIRKAIKSGVKVQHEGSMIALEKLAALHHDNMNKIRGLSKPYKVFKSIYECFSYDKDYRVYIATKDGIEVAILLVFFFNKTAEYFIPATKLEYREFQPMSLMIFKAMQEAVKRNLLYWNWGGTWISQKGVYNFKKRWGTRDYPYYYYVKVYDDNLLSRNHQELVAQYPFYYTVPFNKLKE